MVWNTRGAMDTNMFFLIQILEQTQWEYWIWNPILCTELWAQCIVTHLQQQKLLLLLLFIVIVVAAIVKVKAVVKSSVDTLGFSVILSLSTVWWHIHDAQGHRYNTDICKYHADGKYQISASAHKSMHPWHKTDISHMLEYKSRIWQNVDFSGCLSIRKLLLRDLLFFNKFLGR